MNIWDCKVKLINSVELVFLVSSKVRPSLHQNLEGPYS